MKRHLIILTIFLTNLNLFAQELKVDIDLNSEKFRQFDFWIGEWDVNLRKHPSDNSNSWMDWKNSKAKIYKILDGRAILELWEEQSKDTEANTIIGYSLRYYYPDLDKWVLWLNWPGVNTSGSRRMTGEFRHGRGEFSSTRPLNDSISLISKYTFSDITSNSLRWDNVFSQDDGKTWADSWIMEFSRTAKNTKLPTANELHTYRNGNRCTNTEFGKLESFVGNWHGSIKREGSDWKKEKANINNYLALGGCAIFSFMEVGNSPEESFKEFGLHTFNTYVNKYEDGRLTSDPTSDYRAFFGEFINDNQLQLDRKSREDGSSIETYVWTFVNTNELKLQKWRYEDDKKIKALEGTFYLD